MDNVGIKVFDIDKLRKSRKGVRLHPDVLHLVAAYYWRLMGQRALTSREAYRLKVIEARMLGITEPEPDWRSPKVVPIR